jgi:chromatin remodeling complex protein RSC6
MPKLSSSTSAAAVATPAPVAKKVTETSTPKTPKAPKSETASAKKAVEVVVADAPAPAATPAPKKKAAAKTAAPAPAAVEAVVVATDAAAAAPTSAPSSEYTEFMTKLQQVGTLISSLRSDFRSLEKKSSRDLKLANKANAKRARKQKGNRSPSGFVKPTLISAELATFLGKEAGTQMARTEVTREINAYIRLHVLQDKANGRKINADSSLSSLLKLKEGEELTYFNLQRYMSPHFIKTAAPAAVVVA